MRILVTGARGQLGRALLDILPAAGHQAIGVDLDDGDLAMPYVAEHLIADRAPDHVIHAAAYNGVDCAETEREAALAGNTTATRRVAAACERRGCALTYVSTDYVFNGTCADGYREEESRDPVNWYGETKARGEVAALSVGSPVSVVRTSWLFGPGPTNFVRTIRRLLRQRDTVQVVHDQRGSPTYAPDLAELLLALALRPASGIFHGTNRGICTWFEFACEIARLDGLDPARIRPCSTADYPTPARRPACSVLLDNRLADLGIAPLPAWQDAVARYLAWLDRNEERAEP